MTAFLLNTNKIFPKADPVNRTLCNISHFTPEYLSISLLFLCFSVSISLSLWFCVLRQNMDHLQQIPGCYSYFLVTAAKYLDGNLNIRATKLAIVAEDVNKFFKTAKQKPSELNVYGLK